MSGLMSLISSSNKVVGKGIVCWKLEENRELCARNLSALISIWCLYRVHALDEKK